MFSWLVSATEYLFGENSIKYLKFFYFVPPLLAVTMDVEAVWSLADMAVGFIILPNMIALLILSPKFVKLFRAYRNRIDKEELATRT